MDTLITVLLAVVGSALLLPVLVCCLTCRLSETERRQISKGFSQSNEETDVSKNTLSEPFLQDIAARRARAEASRVTAVREHKSQLHERFSSDIGLKESLSRFAQEQKLDEALIAIWEEIESYPERSKRDDFAKCNELGVTSVSGSRQDGLTTVQFGYGMSRFKLTGPTSKGYEKSEYVKYSLSENGEEVFSINCAARRFSNERAYECFDVVAFKRRGEWAKMLVELDGRLKTREEMGSASFEYFGAENIKSRFES